MSQYNLKISDLYDLIIGGTYKLFVDDVAAQSALARRWDGSKWVLLYDWGSGNEAHYYDGTSWVRVSLH